MSNKCFLGLSKRQQRKLYLLPPPAPPFAMHSASAPRPRRPHRSSGARRAQEACAQARCVQKLLGSFSALGHRGCRPTRLGAALAAALAVGGAPTADEYGEGFHYPAPTAPPLPTEAGGAGPYCGPDMPTLQDGFAQVLALAAETLTAGRLADAMALIGEAVLAITARRGQPLKERA